MQAPQRRNPGFPDLWSPSLDSTLRVSLRLPKIAPGDFVTPFHPGYTIDANRAWR